MVDSFRLATFNLETLEDSGQREADFLVRLAGLREKLATIEADVLCLQEVNAQKPSGERRRRFRALTRLIDGTRYAQYQLVGTANPESGSPSDVHNLVLLSRFPIRHSRQVLHDFVAPLAWPEPAGGGEGSARIRWDRPLLYASIDIGESRLLHVVNLHLRAPRAAAVLGRKRSACAWRDLRGWALGLLIASLKRAGQALECRLMIEELFDSEPNAWLAVCGDFNADENELPLRLIGDADDIRNDQLAGRLLSPIEGRAAESGRYSVLHRGRKLMLDHMLVSSELSRLVSSVHIENVGLADEATAPGPGVAGSFHAPLVATFSLSGGS